MKVTDEAVETVAEYLAEVHSGRLWHLHTSDTRALLIENYRPTARNALQSALPHMTEGNEAATPAIDREALERLAERWASMDTPGLSAPANQEWATGVDQGYSNAAAELLALIGGAK